MNKNLARGLIAAAAASGLAVLSPATPAFAQGLSIPPRQDARSPTGVSYGSGSFTYEARDLAIGGEQGLTLNRTYISNVPYTSLGGIGWTHNWSGRISLQPVPLDPGSPLADPQRIPYIYNVTVSGRSAGFIGGSHFPPTTGLPQGTYEAITPSGATLVYTGTNSTNGYYIFTDSDGTVINFATGGQPMRIQDQILPDGTRLVYGYDTTGTLRSVISNRGYAILIERGTPQGPTTPPGPWKACAVNLTQHVVTATSACPAGVQSVTYTYTLSSANIVPQLAGATDADGQTTAYAYEGAGNSTGQPRLTCITLPGQSACQVDNDYSPCFQRNPLTEQMEWGGAHVTAQHTATGETYAYSYGFAEPEKCEGVFSNYTTMTVNGTVATNVYPVGNVPGSIVDPLGRTTSFRYMIGESWAAEPGQLVGVTSPLGNATDSYNDARGNIYQQTLTAIPGSGLAARTTTAVFPSSCGPTNRRICNKPTSVTDANGNVTDYTYDAVHGGVLTETGPAPAPGGVRPQTRHAYAQRYAWILASGGGYAQAATPVWVRTATSSCRTSAATGNPASPCATAGDEVLTQYDYGPNSGPNTLLLRGQTVTSTDGGVTTTLRSCYGYDRDGRRISETQPQANLASCP
ncbi:MAG: hypothetical protein QOD42_805 [Sphingomonadales bacterium]|nr:hypothetical protein [Sphingomonadales bacterium]